MRTNLIPAEDLPKITRWLETFSLREIAEKQKLNVCHVKRFIAEHNVSAKKVKQEYRKRVIRLNPGATKGELINMLGCSYLTLRKSLYEIQDESEQCIPDEDLYLVTELLKTMTAKQVAEKWEVDENQFNWFVIRHKISNVNIKFEHRAEVIMQNSHESNFELAIILDCCEATIKNTKAKMKARGMEWG